MIGKTLLAFCAILLPAWLVTLCQTPGCPKFSGPEYPDITTSYCLDRTYGWVGLYELFDDGWNPSIARTNDGGDHWSVSEIHKTGYSPESIYFLNHSRGWIVVAPEDPDVAPECRILVTSDGAYSWTELPTQSQAPCASEMIFISPTTGWALGHRHRTPDLLWVTRDGGANWSEQTLPMPRNCQNCQITYGRPPLFRDRRHGELTVSIPVGRIEAIQITYKTDDGGRSWKITGSYPCF